MSTPLTAGGRSLLLSDRIVLKLARSSDTNDRVAPELPSLALMARVRASSTPQVVALALVHLGRRRHTKAPRDLNAGGFVLPGGGRVGDDWEMIKEFESE